MLETIRSVTWESRLEGLKQEAGARLVYFDEVVWPEYTTGKGADLIGDELDFIRARVRYELACMSLVEELVLNGRSHLLHQLAVETSGVNEEVLGRPVKRGINTRVGYLISRVLHLPEEVKAEEIATGQISARPSRLLFGWRARKRVHMKRVGSDPRPRARQVPGGEADTIGRIGPGEDPKRFEGDVGGMFGEHGADED